MRLDHIAYRTADRVKTAQFFMDAFGYHVQQEFAIDFPDGSKAQCIALEPPEKRGPYPWVSTLHLPRPDLQKDLQSIPEDYVKYHLAPEIFVSDGGPDSIVGKWVMRRDGIGGIHHMAYHVESVEETMKYWIERGWAEFTSHAPMKCPGIVQVFSKPHPLTGMIYEFIERGDFGFCQSNVKALMESSQDFK